MAQSAPPAYVPLVEVTRSGMREGVHYGAVVALTAAGEVGYALGDVTAPMFPRSAAKPFQALAALRAGARLTGSQVAIAAGSHSGADIHVASVTATLAAAGLTEADLGCPEDWPMDRRTRDALLRADGAPSRTLMNCSGKHAAMLDACVRRGWDLRGYLSPSHPLQLLIREAVEEKCGEPIAHTAVDGCGAPQLAVSLTGLARGFQAMALAPEGSIEHTINAAMRAFPEYVAGEGRVDTVLMRALPGATSKIGAEGVIVVAAPTGETAAVKISDGDPLPRAGAMVALTALSSVGADISGTEDLLATDVTGGGGVVGVIRPLG
ncbi:asparaginase [Nocardiopsis ansamitocini]|uniref:Asparaginase n=1 Tax=Nocardiopsis ansamitocini TaxID=1670832 RepID=A0A9W6P5R3_9ACTN|nr:asparaginase [Nocardiopsis ansamitocini]GLU47651.1 asparaginase [Nocardiopsis ansamitocini]